MQSQPFKLCPACGQRLALHMTRCGRCYRPLKAQSSRAAILVGLILVVTLFCIVVGVYGQRRSAVDIPHSASAQSPRIRVIWMSHGGFGYLGLATNIGAASINGLRIGVSAQRDTSSTGFYTGTQRGYIHASWTSENANRPASPQAQAQALAGINNEPTVVNLIPGQSKGFILAVSGLSFPAPIDAYDEADSEISVDQKLNYPGTP